MFKIEKGSPLLGSNVSNNGVNFGIYSKHATKVVLNIFDDENSSQALFSCELNSKINRTGDVWHIFLEGIKKNMFYTWQIGGPTIANEGQIFDFENHLLDPYSRIYTKNIEMKNRKNVVVDDKIFDRYIKRPKINKVDEIVYELHISLFTKSETSMVSKRGTIKGLIEKLDYLKELGVTTIELLPIFEFDDYSVGKNEKTGEQLLNIWGYNPIGFFALTNKYTSVEKSNLQYYEAVLKEFIEFVDTAHEKGLEIILDVVYNHTAEGNGDGFVYNFKGMDNSIFYMLENNKKYYKNYSGTGNTFNCNHPVAKNIILDSLRYWYTKIGVDGFRFDLGSILGRGEQGKWLGTEYSLINDISKDMILCNSKFYAEAWDAGGGYYLNEFPENFSIWNDKYRDCIRRFIKGDCGVVYELSQRIQGSPDIFKFMNKTVESSLNFITAHDGFTMWDLVSYNQKNNFLNGEKNSDGENNNNSWNHGVEGESTCSKINKTRRKQIKNMITILMISQGVPMISMGDELCRTQDGNNNAYCHNSSLNRVDWDRAKNFKEIRDFFRAIINFRKKNSLLRNRQYEKIEEHITFHGVKPSNPDFSYYSHTLGVMFKSGKRKIYVALNSYSKPLDFLLPKVEGKEWNLIMDTNIEGDSFLQSEVKIKDNKYKVRERSCIIAMINIED